MATGSQDDIAHRLDSVLPPSWFPTPAPNKWAILNGLANAASYIYNLITFAKLQTRISTASGMFLDLIAYDYFGLRFARKSQQSDASFSIAIKKELLRPKVTRAAIYQAVSDLTGTPVSIYEPWNAGDTGGWGVNFAYDAAGSWGAQLPYTVFVNAVEPTGAGIPYISGFDSNPGGWGAGLFYLVDNSLTTGVVKNSDIYSAINNVRPDGVTVWVNIGPPPLNTFNLDTTFVLDSSTLA